MTSSFDDEESVYLKPNFTIEPLVCGWNAWPHLVSPAQHAMNVAFRHLPLLKSFVAAPGVHAASTRDPKLFGGPFVGLTEENVPEIKNLITSTTERCAKLIEFAKQFKSANELLQGSATGYCLNEFYHQLPPLLRGLVELTYDVDNRVTIRLIEELLYDEGLSLDAMEIALSLNDEQSRDFFMSTPRLRTRGRLIKKMPFSDQRIDTLSLARLRPVPFHHLTEQFEIGNDERSVFKSFFTPTRHSGTGIETHAGIHIRYFGHACVLIQSSGITTLIDPIFAWNTNHNDGRMTFHDLPEYIDYVVLSHNHQDHFSPETLLQLRKRVGKIIVPANNAGSISDPSMKLTLGLLGCSNVEVVSHFDSVTFPGGSIISLPFPGEHCDLDIRSKQAILLEIGAKRLLFLVDSDGWDEALYERLSKRIGKRFDAIFLGMECHGAPLTWLYGPLLTKTISRKNDESRRLTAVNSERACGILRHLDSNHIFVYAMGQEPWLRYIMGLEYTSDSIQLKEVRMFAEKCNTSERKVVVLNGSCDIKI